MPPESLVSVVIPVHDAAPYIAEAIESVLAQTHSELELIVVDDGSEDDSAEIARGFEPAARVVEMEWGGEARARNRGVELSTGAYLGFLDADDRWLPDKLQLQLAALADPEVEIAFGHMRQFRSPELGPEVGAFAGEGETLPCVMSGGMLVSRADFDRVGPFADFRIASTMDWLMRARDLGLRERMLPEVVLHRRLHPRGHTVRDREHFGDYARILKASLDRKREMR